MFIPLADQQNQKIDQLIHPLFLISIAVVESLGMVQDKLFAIQL